MLAQGFDPHKFRMSEFSYNTLNALAGNAMTIPVVGAHMLALRAVVLERTILPASPLAELIHARAFNIEELDEFSESPAESS